MNSFIKNIILILFLIFLSCDKDGTIVHGDGYVHESTANRRDYSEPNQSIDLSGNYAGCSEDSEGDNLCYSLDDVFFDFTNSNGFQVDFHKFNYAHIQENAPHDQLNDILTLQSFNNTWLLGIPSSSIVDNSDQILIVPQCNEEEGEPCDESFQFGSSDHITNQVDDPLWCACNQTSSPQECADDSDCIKIIQGEITLSSKQFENIEEIKWNVSQGRYDIDPIQSDQFNQSYLYSL